MGFGVLRQSDAAPLTDHLDPMGIAADLRHLLKVAKFVLAYANQLVAHLSETEHVPVTLGDVNRAVKAIEEVFVKYYAIIVGPSLVGSSRPSSMTGWRPLRSPGSRGRQPDGPRRGYAARSHLC
jgi:hypothetical protein